MHVFISQTILPGNSVVKNPPAKQETWIRSLGWEDALEKEMTIPSSTLAWKTSGTREAWRAPLDTKSQTGLND